MRTSFLRGLERGAGCLLAGSAALYFVACEPVAAQISGQPVITRISTRGTNVIVAVDVPSGARRITLEGRRRLDVGTWMPAAVRQLDGAAATVTFVLPMSQNLEMLRIRADSKEPLAASLYVGTNVFSGPPTNQAAPVSFLDGNLGKDGAPGPEGQRDVTESDIWKIQGDRLYFFNQYRGLQIVDITNPDSAHLLATLTLPAAGEQMYVPDSNHLILLAHTGCSYDQSQIVVVGATNDSPSILTNFDLPGQIQESRMVGSALYVASQTYRAKQVDTNVVWEWGTQVSAFDLAQPSSPVPRNTLWYAGYGNVVTATDTCLFVGTQDPTNWWQTILRIVDITSPDGRMAEYDSLQLAGWVADKFKLNYADGVLAVASEDFHSGSAVVTRLETFRVPDPRTVPPFGAFKLGELDLAPGERLFATRFDGTRAYLVTFLRIDPLWVVDLSDPTLPRIVGALDVPGFSTYIEPLGDRLVALGIETNRVAVSLFDVTNPAKPGILSRVLLGDNYSWTEANYDEKAFKVFEDAGLILVPFSGDSTNGWTSRVQVIDLSKESLVARGVIEHRFQPRRAALSHQRVLSLSGQELLSADVTDRDVPVVRGDLELASGVDQLLIAGEFTIQAGSSSDSWWAPKPAVVRVAAAGEPNNILNQLDLGEVPITGMTLRDGWLYVAQSKQGWFYNPDPAGGSGPTNEFIVTRIDATKLPLLQVAGRSVTELASSDWTSGWEAVWPAPNTLVWTGPGGDSWWWPWVLGRGGPMDSGLWFWPGFRYGGGHLLAYDVGSSLDPKLISEVNLTTNGWWGFSRSFQVGKLIYFSHSATSQIKPEDPTTGWLQGSYLDVVDYTDPAFPGIRPPVPLSGTLQGVSREGELLYTEGIHWTTNQTDWREWLDATSYNGVSTYCFASLPLPDAWPHPVAVLGDTVFVGRPDYNGATTNPQPHALEAWTIEDKGAFVQTATVPLALPLNTLAYQQGLLTGNDSSTGLRYFDARNPGAPVPLGGALVPGGCIWFDLLSAKGSLQDGLWIPLGVYGVVKMPPPIP